MVLGCKIWFKKTLPGDKTSSSLTKTQNKQAIEISFRIALLETSVVQKK